MTQAILEKTGTVEAAHARSSSDATSGRAYFAANNFDLIRLVAAFQVLLVHAVAHLKVESLNWIPALLAGFPGVPVFFFISGFLITAAWERRPDVRVFYANRFYRIYPALWVCVLVSAAAVLVFSDASLIRDHVAQFSGWILAQGTFVQAWNPAFLRSFGVGVVNGALWTITVELAFYASVPVLYWLFRRGLGKVATFALIAVASFTMKALFEVWVPADSEAEIFKKALVISPLPWMGMFCVGALAQHYISTLHPLVTKHARLIVLVFVTVSILTVYWPVRPWLSFGNDIGLINYPAVCALVLACAYSQPLTADTLLHKNDYSYGLYIFHMPVINVVLQLGLLRLGGFALVLATSGALAVASWWWVEKPALRRKTVTLHAR